MPRSCGANSAGGTRASARYSTRWTKRFAGRFMTASRYRPGRRAASRCLATRRIRCCRILARERTSRSKMAWRSPPCSRRRRAPGCRLCSPPTSGCAASASPRCSLARASTACASIQPTTIFACATRARRACRVSQAALQLRRRAGRARRGGRYLGTPVFPIISVTRFVSSAISALCASGPA